MAAPAPAGAALDGPVASPTSVFEPVAKGWKQPTGDGADHPLRVYNSLTRSKVPFVPMAGRKVLWYMCGPTVYDSAHMGHARTYITFDILRRILSQFFNYDVVLTMNITDIDDKIIRRSTEAGVPFVELARKYEAEFLADMTSLGVLPPDVMTRVSEYVPEIVAFIEKIIANGYAYESDGSVYFSVKSYASCGKHTYAKLFPENVGNKEALEEGEGVLLAASVGAKDKRDGCDFALWKKSKEGEPWWDSPWGRGRPGWHIECSAMCAETLGPLGTGPIDIHSGGIDLRFPHHDNEIAQAEAYYEHDQWVNYFLHTGHLHIDGLKMSKSLKNFIKISSALEAYGARRLRFLFLAHRYNAPMEYSEEVMDQIAFMEKTFVEFFLNVKGALRSLTDDAPAKWEGRDRAFAATLDKVKAAVREALADDFDTPGVLALLRGLVTETNKYMTSDGTTRPVLYLLKSTVDYVSHIFRVFGLIDANPSVGFSVGGDAGGSLETTIAPYLDVLASFREIVRDAARAKDLGKVLAACDQLRDEMLPELGVVFEDVAAPKGGAGGGEATTATTGARTAWKLRSPVEIKRELEEKKRIAADKIRLKAEAEERKRKEEEDKRRAASVPPHLFFLSQTDKYSAFDDKGMPTVMADGKPVTDKARGKLQAVWDKQAKAHEWFLSLPKADA